MPEWMKNELLRVLAYIFCALAAKGGFDICTSGGCPGIPVPPHVVPPPTPPSPPVPPPPGPLRPEDSEKAVARWGSGCTCTIVGPSPRQGMQFVLTAAHCCRMGQRVTVKLADGRSYTATVVRRDTDADLAIAAILTPDSLPFAPVARSQPAVGSKVWHKGHGVDVPGNIERGEIIVAGHAKAQCTMLLSVSPGDSGSGIFLDTGEVVSVVCCTESFGRKVKTYGGSWEQLRRILTP